MNHVSEVYSDFPFNDHDINHFFLGGGNMNTDSDNKKTSFACRICGNTSNNKKFVIREMMFGYNDLFPYFECASCGCLQIENVPPDMTRYYPGSYYSFKARSSPVEPQSFIPKLRRLLRRKIDNIVTFQKRFSPILKHIFPDHTLIRTLKHYLPPNGLSGTDIKENSRVLDLGCGSGKLLLALNRAGVKNLLGVDAYIEKDIEYSKNFKILKSTIGQIEGSFDCIMFHHSFEHIENPIFTLKKVSRILSPEGFCLIRIPIVSSYAWEHYRENWVQLDAPRHFFLHSLDSMKYLAKEASLKIDRIVYDSNDFQFWASEQYLKNIPLFSERSFQVNQSNSLFSPEEIKLFEQKAQKLNETCLGDQAAFYLSPI